MAMWRGYLSSTQMLTSTSLSLSKATALGVAMYYPQSSVTSHSGNLFLVQVLGWPRPMVRERTHCSSDLCSNSTSSLRAQPHGVRFLSVWLILHAAGLVCAVNDVWLPWSQAVDANGTSSLVRHPEMSPDIDSGPQERGMEWA